MGITKRPLIALDAAVTIEAAQADGENKGPAKFDATFYTGGAMNIAGYDMPVVIDLAGLGRGNVLVANLDHDSTKRVGNFDVTNDGKSLVAHGTATAKTAARDEVIGSALEGYQWQASLEVNPQQIETLAKGKTAIVNGQTVTGPAYITRKGTLKGFGFVSHGADDNTTVAIAATAASLQGTKKMRPEVKAWIEGRFPTIAASIDSMTAEEVANWEADYDGREGVRKPVEKKTQKGGLSSAAKELIEARRVEELDRINGEYLAGLDKSWKTSEFLQAAQENYEQAIEAGTSPDDFERDLWRSRVPMAQSVRAPKSNRQYTNEILQAALCVAGGLKDIDKHFNDQTLQAAHDRFRNGIGFAELFKICADANNQRVDSYQMSLELQRAAFGQLSPMHASTGFSTLSLSGILGTSAYKFLLEGWGGGEMTWQKVTDIVNVRDFKTITQYKLSGTLKYEKVGPAGEIKHGTVAEGSYTVKADTYGRMMAITREHLVNDDMNALSSIPRELGYGANEAFNTVFWTEWLSGDGGFFANTSSGAMSAANALTALAAAEAAYFALTKPNGEPLGANPNVILMPNGTYRNALNAVASGVVVGGSTTLPAVNSFQGAYDVVRSAYLSNTSYSGYSTVKWYLLTVRPGFAPIQTAFLYSQQAPMIESTSADFNTLGVQMRGVHDFGCNLMEARAAIQGSGA